ncbi:peptidase, M16 family protein [Belliella sp. DSM 107340]|uniref:Peptidase, M16 family protein n=1 Tax=Belliella calami TaxID=2923436 RepID=A0ABS9UTQ6_9BACT|nr:peptidase, M16 family protein [Belliella calami]MCH7399996.1 peptidase, M16 family protein [Belliella calami]
MKITSLLVPVLAFGISQSAVSKSITLTNYPSTEVSSLENDPQTVIANYIKAVGGQANIDKIRNAYMEAEADFQGTKIEMLTISDAENSRMKQQTSAMGNVQQKTVLVDGKCTMTVMGQEQPVPEEMMGMITLQTFIFPETKYEELGVELELRGTEEINGEEAHAIVLNLPNGMKTMEYFSVKSGLKLKTSSDVAEDITYSDYQDIEGVLIPRTVTIQSPMLPFALESKFVTIEFNRELTDEDFK